MALLQCLEDLGFSPYSYIMKFFRLLFHDVQSICLHHWMHHDIIHEPFNHIVTVSTP